MNKRKRKWQEEVNEGTKDYEIKHGMEYNYFSNLSRRRKKSLKEEIFH